MDDKFTEKLKKDLEKSGFGAELKARKVFKNRDNWSIFSSNTYIDRDSEKSREIDIYAITDGWLPGHENSHLGFFISCEIKKSKFPWLVFKESATEIFGVKSLDFTYPCDGIEHMKIMNGTGSISDILKYEGAGIHEAFKTPNKSSSWYPACLAAIKSAKERYDKTILYYKNIDNELSNEIVAEIHQPLVVIDGILLSVELSDENEIIINEENYITINIEYGSSKYESQLYDVDIVSLKSLDQYLYFIEKRINNITDRMYDYLENKNIKIKNKGYIT